MTKIITKTLTLKNTNTNMQQIMQAKPGATKPKAEQQCKHAEAGTTWTSDNLKQMKKMYLDQDNTFL